MKKKSRTEINITNINKYIADAYNKLGKNSEVYTEFLKKISVVGLELYTNNKGIPQIRNNAINRREVATVKKIRNYTQKHKIQQKVRAAKNEIRRKNVKATAKRVKAWEKKKSDIREFASECYNLAYESEEFGIYYTKAEIYKMIFNKAFYRECVERLANAKRERETQQATTKKYTNVGGYTVNTETGEIIDDDMEFLANPGFTNKAFF